MSGSDIDHIIDKLAKDVEAAVHALYRGDTRQATARARTDTIVHEAREAVQAAVRSASTGGPARTPAPIPAIPSPRPSVAAPVVQGGAAGLSREEGEAVVKCITAWLPIGPPSTTDPASKCIAAVRDLTPTWGQREKAREVVRRISQP